MLRAVKSSFLICSAQGGLPLVKRASVLSQLNSSQQKGSSDTEYDLAENRCRPVLLLFRALNGSSP